MPPTPEKRRPRRIAADEAHAWARNLRLKNPAAKLVLSMLTQYVNGDGLCWVSIPALAEDCELAPNTVRDRLVWLERTAGVIRRIPQWLDHHGHRNGQAIGKRTSDDIRLLIDVEIARCDDRSGGDDGPAVSPPPGGGLTPEISPPPGGGLIPVSPPAGLQQPSDSVEDLISEPEPEPESTPTPSRGERESASHEESEPEHFAPAWQAWTGHEVMRRDLALAEFRLLSPEKQLLCRAAVPLFNQLQRQLGRTRIPNFHLWIRTRGFDEFPNAKLEPSTAGATRIAIETNSTAGRAITALYAVARTAPFQTSGRIVYSRDVTPQLLALAGAGDRATWLWIEDRQQIAAWSNFLAEHVISARPVLVTTRGVGEDQRSGIYAPWPWPPRKDGTLSPATGDAA